MHHYIKNINIQWKLSIWWWAGIFKCIVISTVSIYNDPKFYIPRDVLWTYKQVLQGYVVYFSWDILERSLKPRGNVYYKYQYLWHSINNPFLDKERSHCVLIAQTKQISWVVNVRHCFSNPCPKTRRYRLVLI